MEKDRKAICDIISNMLDNPDKIGIYPTSDAYKQLEEYIESERALALGFAFGFCCASLDTEKDPREIECPAFLDDALKALNNIKVYNS